MTYEQAGHSRGGAAVITNAGDTLTLWDRLYHHFTTGLSTIEITSQHAGKVLQEFKKYYDKARTAPLGEFKAFAVKADEGDKLTRLKKLLDRNGIEWSEAVSAGYTGVNYFSGRAEAFKTTPKDIIINANQPQSNLLKVLFERNSRLSDSATYDITAWSIPFAYGLTTYGLSSYVSGLAKTKSTEPAPTGTAGNENTVAWLVKWNGLNSARFLSEILQKKVKVRYAEKDFVAGNQAYEKGTLIITRTSNQSKQASLGSLIDAAAEKAGVAYTTTTTTFVDKGFDFGSDKVHVLQKPKVALLAGDGVSSLGMGEIWHFFDVQINYPVNVVWVNDLRESVLKNIDVLIMPGGNYGFLSDKEFNAALKDWVRAGGKIIAIENAVAQLARSDWGIKMKSDDDKKEDKKEDAKTDYSLLRRYENRERDQLPDFNPGSIYKIELDNSHPLAFGYDDYYFTLKQDDNIYGFLKEGGWNVGIIKKNNYVAGFVGSKLQERLKDGLLFGVQDMGRGTVIYLADNPLFRSFWENGKLLFCNAVFMVGQ